MINEFATGNARLAAVRSRDRKADGQFVYGVLTTGIYCQPSCASRPARAENLRFFDAPASAEKAGYRACKRCRPDQQGSMAARLVNAASAIADDLAAWPALATMAKSLQCSTAKLNSAFKEVTGLSYAAYVRGHKASTLRAHLGDGERATHAVYSAGYGSVSRVYEKSDALLGMSPARYAAQGDTETLRFAITQSALGPTLIAWTAAGLACVLFDNEPSNLQNALKVRFAKAELILADPAETAFVDAVLAKIDDPGAAFDLPLDIRGTAFQTRVWTALQTIPAGATATYQDIANRIGKPASVRAVANACGANRLAVVIPCHRVVRSDGGLGGYAFGEARKTALLERERDH